MRSFGRGLSWVEIKRPDFTDQEKIQNENNIQGGHHMPREACLEHLGQLEGSNVLSLTMMKLHLGRKVPLGL